MTIPTFVWSALTVVAAVGLMYLFLTRTALGRGFKVPLRQLARKPVTIQYPDVKRDPQPRFHGRHQLNFYEDGLEKCIGCELCAWACPADAIFVQGADNTAEARYSPGERYASDYQINYNRCILCALCIEACPTRALTMTKDYEFSADTREGLIYTKDRLLATPPPGVTPTPHRDEDVRARNTNYYGGLAATPPDLKGGEFAPAGPRPMRKASVAVGGLSERTAGSPRAAGTGPQSPTDQRTVPTSEDTAHLREAGGDPQAPAFRDDGGAWMGDSGDETRAPDGRVRDEDQPAVTDGAGGPLDSREREAQERQGTGDDVPARSQLDEAPEERPERAETSDDAAPSDDPERPEPIAHQEAEVRPDEPTDRREDDRP